MHDQCPPVSVCLCLQICSLGFKLESTHYNNINKVTKEDNCALMALLFRQSNRARRNLDAKHKQTLPCTRQNNQRQQRRQLESGIPLSILDDRGNIQRSKKKDRKVKTLIMMVVRIPHPQFSGPIATSCKLEAIIINSVSMFASILSHSLFLKVSYSFSSSRFPSTMMRIFSQSCLP